MCSRSCTALRSPFRSMLRGWALQAAVEVYRQQSATRATYSICHHDVHPLPTLRAFADVVATSLSEAADLLSVIVVGILSTLTGSTMSVRLLRSGGIGVLDDSHASSLKTYSFFSSSQLGSSSGSKPFSAM